MLSESGGSRDTPFAKRQTNNLAAAFRTPSKRRPVEAIPELPEEEPQQETPRLARTPASETKQFYLANLFATPTTMRYAAMVEAEDNEEAQSNGLQAPIPQISPPAAHSGTPSFLRRSNSGRYPGAKPDGPGLSPIASRKPQRFASKGLSHLVQGLRDMEEDRMDDDWDVMRQMEEEAEAEEASRIQVEDSQGPNTNRKYKKKGQKRTTRRVVMRPVVRQAKPKPNAEYNVQDSDSEGEPATVPETQHASAADEQWDDVPSDIERAENENAAPPAAASKPELDTEDEFDQDSDDDPEFGGSSKAVAKPKSFSERIKEAVSSSAANNPKKQPPPGKPPKTSETAEKKPRPRKVNPQAHANYRSININRGGSSRGRGGRFRRR